MTDEEKKTIDKLKNGKKYTLVEIIRVFKKEGIENFRITRKEYLDIILNLLDKQDNRIKELESDKKIKDKMIEKMAKVIVSLTNLNDVRIFTVKEIEEMINGIIEYYENLAKESGEIDEDNRIIE